jgi:hypothetical protein
MRAQKDFLGAFLALVVVVVLMFARFRFVSLSLVCLTCDCDCVVNWDCLYCLSARITCLVARGTILRIMCRTSS